MTNFARFVFIVPKIGVSFTKLVGPTYGQSFKALSIVNYDLRVVAQAILLSVELESCNLQSSVFRYKINVWKIVLFVIIFTLGTRRTATLRI